MQCRDRIRGRQSKCGRPFSHVVEKARPGRRSVARRLGRRGVQDGEQPFSRILAARAGPSRPCSTLCRRSTGAVRSSSVISPGQQPTLGHPAGRSGVHEGGGIADRECFGAGMGVDERTSGVECESASSAVARASSSCGSWCRSSRALSASRRNPDRLGCGCLCSARLGYRCETVADPFAAALAVHHGRWVACRCRLRWMDSPEHSVE